MARKHVICGRWEDREVEVPVKRVMHKLKVCRRWEGREVEVPVRAVSTVVQP